MPPSGCFLDRCRRLAAFWPGAPSGAASDPVPPSGLSGQCLITSRFHGCHACPTVWPLFDERSQRSGVTGGLHLPFSVDGAVVGLYTFSDASSIIIGRHQRTSPSEGFSVRPFVNAIRPSFIFLPAHCLDIVRFPSGAFSDNEQLTPPASKLSQP